MSLRDILYLAEERAAVLRALDMDKDRDDAQYRDLQESDQSLVERIYGEISNLPDVQKQQLDALLDPLMEYFCVGS